MWVAIVGSRSLDTCDCPPVVLGAEGGHHPAEQIADGGPSCVRLTVYFLILSILARVSKRSGFEGIVSGGAHGVDSLAEYLATMGSIPVKVYRPSGEKGRTFGEKAHKRNERIVKQAAGGLVIAIFDPRKPKSNGTSDTVGIARHTGTEVHEWHGRWEQ